MFSELYSCVSCVGSISMLYGIFYYVCRLNLSDTYIPDTYILPLLMSWVSYWVVGGFIEYMVTFGGWKSYLLLERVRNIHISISYKRQLLCSVRDLFIILPLSYWVLHDYISTYDPNYYNRPLYNFIRLVCGMFIGYCWRMFVHWILHRPSLYYLHKSHHVPLRTMTCFVCFTDGIVENIFMEILGTMMLPLLICPSPPRVIGLVWMYGNITGLLDHSGLYIYDSVLGSLLDSRYHWKHHYYVNKNFAELEILDRLFGTYI